MQSVHHVSSMFHLCFMSSRIVSLPVLGRARDIFGRVQAWETGSSAEARPAVHGARCERCSVPRRRRLWYGSKRFRNLGANHPKSARQKMAKGIQFCLLCTGESVKYCKLMPRVLKSDYNRVPARRSPPRGRCRCTFHSKLGSVLSQLV